MAEEEIASAGSLKAEEKELNNLFRETLDGIRDDIIETNNNAQMYLEAISTAETAGKEAYGQAYNEALKIKQMARDKQLKFLGMFKDRVNVKEKIQIDKDNKKEAAGMPSFGLTQSEMNKIIEEMDNNDDDGDEEDF